MPDHTPARIAAALELAEAADAWHGSHGAETSKRLERAVFAYRATAPKLRTRAEVDAVIALHVRNWEDAGCGLAIGEERRRFLEKLCREPLAPEPSEGE